MNLSILPSSVKSGRFNNEIITVAWVDFLCRVKWDLLVTLTTDPKRPRNGRMRQEGWYKAWRWFIFQWVAKCAEASGLARYERGQWRGPLPNAWKKERGLPMTVAGLEPHRDNRPHLHALVKLSHKQPVLDWKIGTDLWWKARGRAWFEKPHSQGRVTEYVTKYIIKEQTRQDVLAGLEFSQNFDAPRPSWPSAG